MKHGDSQAMVRVVNSVRRYLQTHTCCLETGAEAALMVLASFLLDKCNHDPAVAAVELERLTMTIAGRVRSGDLTLVRDGPQH